MPELTTVPDAQRPIGRFITERVLPRWDSLNRYSSMRGHNLVMNRALGRQSIQVHQTGGLSAAFLHNGRIIGGRQGRETTLVSDQAAEACASKSLTSQYWAAAGVPTAEASRFSSDDAERAREFVSSADAPLVMKPVSGRHGAGLSFGVTADGFDAAWKYAIEANRVPGTGEGVLLEPFHDALCLRFFVIGGQVRAATLRVPLFVAGDGESTVRQLLEESFAHQQRNALLRSTRPRITERLVAGSGLQLTDVPEAGALHILREDPNVVYGGLPYDVTAVISSGLRSLANQAALAIPGLGAAGIDVLTPSLASAEGAFALDADSSASLVMHGYPAFGPRRIVARPLANQLRLRADHWDRPVYSGSAITAMSPEDE